MRPGRSERSLLKTSRQRLNSGAFGPPVTTDPRHASWLLMIGNQK
jgi:hypothetical protein